ncbi:MAG: hypothetical protein FWG98_09185 [Candidatus Cloacimonetes bacterium]|nr:hypothetical protein [Candidatus Cloacimonadota bacterium]
MDIASIVGMNNNAQAQAQEAMTGDRLMGKDDFLKMLTMQLRYQDPLNPMSNDQFAAQLAQFSSLEALNNINDNIQTQILMNQSMNNSFMVNMIGKDVKSYGNLVGYEGENVNIEFQLFSDAQNVTVRIFDDTGREVAVLNDSNMRVGDRSITWNGMTKNGTEASKEIYSFTVEATNREGLTVPVETMNNGVVSGITYEGGMPYLIVNGAYVNLRDIISINQGS